MKRPAEKVSASGSLALLVGYAAGIRDAEALVAVGVVLGLVPAAVTLLVSSGGVRGVAARLWRGKA
jgi:hypothetical protein